MVKCSSVWFIKILIILDIKTDVLVSQEGGGLKVTDGTIEEIILAVMENRKPLGMKMTVSSKFLFPHSD